MSRAEVWNEGDEIPGHRDRQSVRPMTQAELDAAWTSLRARMTDRGLRFEDMDLGDGVVKFGGLVDADTTVEDFVNTFETALVERFGDLSLGVILVRMTPAAIASGYVRARFGFRRDA